MRIHVDKWRLSPAYSCLVIGLLSLLMACFNYTVPISNITSGLDNAWAYTLSYLFEQGQLMGRDNFFTFGPLGFLEHTRGVSQSILNYSLFFWLVIILLTNFVTYRLAFTTATNNYSLIVHILIASYLLLNIYNGGQKLLIAVYVTAILAWLTQKHSYTVLLGVLTSLAICMKFSYGAVALVALCGVSATLSIHLKTIRPLLIAGLSAALSYSAIWIVCGGSPIDGARYFIYGLEFTRGSATAMANFPNIAPLMVIGAISALCMLITLSLARSKPKGILIACCFLLIAFIWIKYSFGRFDNGHLSGVMYFAYIFFLISLLLNNSIVIKAISSALTAAFFLFWLACHNTQTGQPLFFTFDVNSPKNNWFFSQLTDKNVFKKQQNTSKKQAEEFQLSSSIKEKIGSATTAVYPWESFIAYANDLNWQSMPVIQNYVAYTPKLDHRNALFFESDKAPQFIIWHHHSFASIDNRHHLSGDPRTVTAILTNYQKTACDEIACLWEKRSNPLILKDKKRQHVPIQLDQWITLPAGDTHRFYISSQLTVKGMIYNILLKEADLKIEYAFENGTTRQHRFIRENAKHGLWVSPYTVKPNEDLAKYGKVKAIRFKTSHPQHYEKWIGYWSVNEFPVEQL